jgi:hypothetical protein
VRGNEQGVISGTKEKEVTKRSFGNASSNWTEKLTASGTSNDVTDEQIYSSGAVCIYKIN